jgi:RimJ/RimL family protein N-acetyltransferase
MMPFDLTLETSKVLLRPLAVDDYDALYELAQDADMWKYFTLNLADEKHLKKWFEQAFVDRAANTRRAFTIIDKETGELTGSMSLMNVSFHDLRTEIGSSWLGKKFRSTGINKHAKFAMMPMPLMN